MKGPRILHILMLIVAAALGAATALGKISPAWGAPLAVVAGILTNLETVLQGLLARGATAVFLVLFTVTALFGQSACSHLQQAAAACEPTTDEIKQGVAAFTPATFKTEVADFVKTHGLCIAKAIADQILDGKLKFAAPVGAGEPPVVAHARAWRAENP